jgi:hypothetical protein
LLPASSDAKDIATRDGLVCWRAEIVKVIDRGSDKLAVSVAAKFHSNETLSDAGRIKTISDDLAMRML